MAVNLSPIWGAGAQLFDNSGNVLTGGKIYTYAAGTTTPAATYTSSSGITANSNPIILNSAGRVPYEIWLTDGISYKFVLKDSNDTLIATYDNLSGINSNFIAYTAQQEIQTATAGQTVFNLTTMQYQPATNNLSVFVDGVNQYGPGASYAYVETDSDTVTFVSGLHVGASVKFTTASPVSSAVVNAENVEYDPPFTGSVPTNAEAKLAQTVSVKDFGAVGDGVTDDTQAIQDAINAVEANNGGTLYFPTGIYLVTAPIEANNSVIHLLGDGVKATTILANHTSGPAIQIKWYFSGIASMTIEGSAARRAASAGTNYGIYFPTDPLLVFSRFGNYVRDVIVQSHPSHGIFCTVTGFEIADARILNVGGHGIYLDNFDPDLNLRAGQGEIKNVQIANTTGHAICAGINRSVYRVVLDNIDCFFNALTAGVRQSLRSIHIVGENTEIRNSGIGGWAGDSPRVATLGGVYIDGRSPYVENNRFIDVVSPAVELGTNSDGARVIDNQITGEVQPSLDPMVLVNSGCLGVYVRQGFPANVTTAMTPAPMNSGNRSEIYDVSPQGFRSAINSISVADDAIYTFSFTGAAQGILVLNGNSAFNKSAMIAFRVGDANAHATLLTNATNVAATTTAGTPSGTAGVDGDLTFFADTTQNNLYVNNRRGGAGAYMPCFISLMQGELVI
jgi:hypothetical protein